MKKQISKQELQEKLDKAISINSELIGLNKKLIVLNKEQTKFSDFLIKSNKKWMNLTFIFNIMYLITGIFLGMSIMGRILS